MKRSNFLKSLLALPFITPFLSSAEEKVVGNSEPTFFTPEMLRRYNYGLFIINTKATPKVIKENPGYSATVSWKLGYCNHPFKHDKDDRYGKINFLTDGWFCPLAKDAEGMCEYLNNNPHGDKFRLMTREEVIYLLTVRKQGFLTS